ncbi:hypothetical protein [Streptacidiphilus cavernicola]|uniref:Uncharacterized protein n=1 Tax=Streptacidiphilus cavernicola TaxID=3342716 RepID=A0ABV6VY46_9ACTN
MSACYGCDSGRYTCPEDEGRPGCPFIAPGSMSEQAAAYLAEAGDGWIGAGSDGGGYRSYG